MDILFHLILGFVASKQIFGEYLIIIAFFSILPDLIGTTLLQILHIKSSSKNSIKQFISDWRNKSTFYGKFDKVIYRLTHSLVGWFILSLFLIFTFDNYLVYSLAYLSHIIIDVFTHDKNYSVRLFYPFSDFHIEGRNWATNKDIFMIFWIILISILLLQIII